MMRPVDRPLPSWFLGGLLRGCLLVGWAGLVPALAVEGKAFDPAADVWSREALEDGARSVKSGPLPSDFLGGTSGMRPFTSSHQAWFADGFRLANYQAIVLPPWTNGMGRYHVTGQELLRRSLAEALSSKVGAWRGKVVAPPERTAVAGADLMVFGNVHQFKNSANDVEYVIELVGVDRAGMAQFKLQNIVGSSGTGAMAAAGAAAFASSDNLLSASLSAGLAMAMAMPTDRDQFGFYDLAVEEVGRRIPAALVAADRQLTKGKGDVPHSPATALAPAMREDAQQENFGGPLSSQVAEYVAIVANPAAKPSDRADRLRDLGKIGALAAVPVAIAILQDDAADNRLQENAAWALGEIGHPDALPALESAKGVDRFNVKAAILKIREY
jgi:hypothetical protein